MYPIFGQIKDSLDVARPDWHTEVDGITKIMHHVENGGTISLESHIKTLILALLSSGRVWSELVPHIESGEIDAIFFDYDPEKIKAAKPEDLVKNLKSISCGNRTMHPQMKGMAHSVEVLQTMYKDNLFDIQHGYYGYTHDSGILDMGKIDILTNLFACGRGRGIDDAKFYKIGGAGVPLICEYLKGVGVDVVKPDLHVCRILGRIGYHSVNYQSSNVPCTQPASVDDAIEVCYDIAREYGMTAIEVDTVLWQYGAVGKGDICKATPVCSRCKAVSSCPYYAGVASGTIIS